MDKISKRSKGFAFVEYTTEEAASTALREMNGKVALFDCFCTIKKSSSFSKKSAVVCCFMLSDHQWLDDNSRCCQDEPTKVQQGPSKSYILMHILEICLVLAQA